MDHLSLWALISELEAENAIIKITTFGPRLWLLPRTQTKKLALKKGRVGARGFTPRIQGGCVSPGLVCVVPVQFTGTKLDTGYFRSAVQSLAPVCRRWRAKPSRENSADLCYTRYSPRLLEATWRIAREAREVLESPRVLLYSGVWFSVLFISTWVGHNCTTFVHNVKIRTCILITILPRDINAYSILINGLSCIIVMSVRLCVYVIINWYIIIN